MPCCPPVAQSWRPLSESLSPRRHSSLHGPKGSKYYGLGRTDPHPQGFTRQPPKQSRSRDLLPARPPHVQALPRPPTAFGIERDDAGVQRGDARWMALSIDTSCGPKWIQPTNSGPQDSVQPGKVAPVLHRCSSESGAATGCATLLEKRSGTRSMQILRMQAELCRNEAETSRIWKNSTRFLPAVPHGHQIA